MRSQVAHASDRLSGLWRRFGSHLECCQLQTKIVFRLLEPFACQVWTRCLARTRFGFLGHVEVRACGCERCGGLLTWVCLKTGNPKWSVLFNLIKNGTLKQNHTHTQPHSSRYQCSSTIGLGAPILDKTPIGPRAQVFWPEIACWALVPLWFVRFRGEQLQRVAFVLTSLGA